jgi:tetratricopeptide (TPR) repeat protein
MRLIRRPPRAARRVNPVGDATRHVASDLPADVTPEQIRALRDAGRFVEAIRLAQALVATRPRDAACHAELGLVHLHSGHAAEAAPCFQQAVRLAPTVAEHHYNLSSTLEQLGRDGEAVAGFRRAVELAPRHPEALERLGNLLLTYGRPAEAIDCFRRAAAAAPATLQARLMTAKMLVLDGRNAEAEADLRETLRLHPTSAETHRFLATILREQGRFQEAIPLLERATEGNALQAATAYYDLALSRRVTADDQPMLEQMLALLRRETLPDPYRARVHFGLGKAFDDVCRYGEAMGHFESANRLARQGRTFDRAQFAVAVRRLIASFTPDYFASHRDGGAPSEMPVLIVGMPRSGTTLIEQIVSSHPEVAAGGELTFWHRQAEAEARPGTRNPAAEYQALLRRIAPDARRVTDKMPGNFLWIGLIHRTFPHARIIHCQRHPVDTCLSNYFTNFSTPMPFTNDKGDLAFYYRQYERLMAHWRAVLPASCLMDVSYEELVADPEPLTRGIVAFLGLTWDDACLRPEANRGPVKTASMWQARQPTYRSSVERWRRYEPWLGELAQLLRADEPPATVRRPPKALALVRRAAHERVAGKLEEAARLLAEAAALSANDAMIENEVGLIYLQRHDWPAATNSFERAVALEPDFAIAHYNLACALERQRQPDAAISAYRDAIAHAPRLAEAHTRLGNLLHARGRHEEALDCFRQAFAASPDTTLGRMSQIKLLLMDGRDGEAEVLLRQLLATDPASSEAWRLLGNTLREAGRFDEAASCLEKAIALDPTHVAAHHDLVHTRRMREVDRPLIRRMQARLQGTDLTDFDRALLHFALGKGLDDLGACPEAMRHFDAGNRLERAGLAFDRTGFANGVDRLIARFTPELLAALGATGDPSELPVLVLGMPRSGTTLVEQIVSSHPQVGAGGELRFWNERAPAEIELAFDPARLRATAADYVAQLRQIAPTAKRVTDKNPFNFLWIGQIHLALPHARIIHCSRNPVDTCLSIYFTRFATRQDFAYDRGDIAFYYRQYERIMAHWRAVLPDGHLLEVDYEALIADRDTLTRRMIAFCGLEWDDACLAPEQNPRVVRTASMWQARQPVYRSSIERWRRYEPWLGELRGLLPRLGATG